MEVMKDLRGREIESCAIDMRYKDQVVVYCRKNLFEIEERR